MSCIGRTIQKFPEKLTGVRAVRAPRRDPPSKPNDSQEALMRSHSSIGQAIRIGEAQVLPSPKTFVTLIAVAAMLGSLLVIANPRPVMSQAVKLVQVDVNVVAEGHRVSKLTGSSVTNEKNEKIGSIDDFVVARDRSLFAVLQVGGFLGLGGHLVAVPYDSLVIDDEGSKIQLLGASKEELRKLPELRYRG
jgi:hypothetical protein